MSIKHLGCTLLALGLTAVVGCGDKQASPPSSSTPTPSVSSADNKDKKKADAHDDHDHGPGPHQGTIGEMGGKHLEFVVNHDTQEATIYILAGDAKKSFPIKAKDGKIKLSILKPKFEVDLVAKPDAGDPEGKSSRFVGKHSNFGTKQEFAGEVDAEDVSVTPAKPYHGEFKEEEEHHDKKK